MDRYDALRQAAIAMTPEQYAAKLAKHLAAKRSRLVARGVKIVRGKREFAGYTVDLGSENGGAK